MTVPTSRERVAELLHRYPDVSSDDTAPILRFLRNGRHLDVGLLTSDMKLKPKLDRFMADHSRHFRVSFTEGAAVLAAIAAFIGLCWLIWEAVKPAALTA